MNYLFTIFFSILLFSCTEEIKKIEIEKEPTTCDCNELILDNSYQRYFLTDKQKPFNGQCITLRPDGKKLFERNYINGKYQGLVLIYHQNGKIKSSTEYEKNLMTGDQKIFDIDGVLISHAIYLRSKLKEIIK